mgnify:FL=1
MNIYYLKKFRKDAKKRRRIMFVDNQYNVMAYSYVDEAWKLMYEGYGDYATPDLSAAKQTLASERRNYILKLVKERREINKNKELAML